jgi:hypothetical protein
MLLLDVEHVVRRLGGSAGLVVAHDPERRQHSSPGDQSSLQELAVGIGIVIDSLPARIISGRVMMSWKYVVLEIRENDRKSRRGP